MNQIRLFDTLYTVFKFGNLFVTDVRLQQSTVELEGKFDQVYRNTDNKLYKVLPMVILFARKSRDSRLLLCTLHPGKYINLTY